MLMSLCACGGKQSEDTSAEGSVSVEEQEQEVEEELPQEEAPAFHPFSLGYYGGVGINPYTCDNSQNQTIVGLVYEPLFQVDESFQPVACIAKSISISQEKLENVVVEDEDESEGDESEDESKDEEESSDKKKDKDKKKKKKTATIHLVHATVKLRDDVKFSDGSALTGDDVAYSLELAKAKGSVYHARLSKLTSISGSTSRVTLTFRSGNTSVAALLDVPIVKRGTGSDKVPVGTGPYQVKLKKGVPHKLTQNQYWWQEGKSYTVGGQTDPADSDEAAEGDSSVEILGETTYTIQRPLKEIGLFTAGDSDELIFGFTSGDISMVSTDITGTDSLSFSGSNDVFDYETTDLLYLGFNTAKGHCKDQELRNALYLGVDRATLVRKSLASHAVAAYMPAAPSAGLYSAKLEEELIYDLAKAKELRKSGGTGDTLDLIVNSDSIFKVDMAKEIKRELEEAGYAIRVSVLDWSDFKQALKKGNYDLYLGEVKMSLNFDPLPFLSTQGSLNYSKFSSKTLNAKLDALYAATGSERTKAAEELYRAFAEEAPAAPLCFKNYSVIARKGYLKHPVATQSNLFHQFYRWSFTHEVLEADGTF